MSSKNLLRVLITAVAVVALSTGCASTGADRTGERATAPPAPAKKPFTPPAFDSTEFRSEEHGFFLHYPSDFQEQPGQGNSVLTVASPSMVPRVDVSVITDSSGSASLEEVAAQVEQTMSQLGGGEAKVTSSRATKLQDEVSPAMEFVVDWSFQGFPLQSVVLMAPVGDEVVNVTVTGMQGGDPTELSGIAYTLYLLD